MDFEKYKIRLNLRTCCLYEQITGKNFFQLNEDEDIVVLMYASFVSNNDLMITFNTFLALIKDKKVGKWLEKEYNRITEFASQIKNYGIVENNKSEGNKDGEIMTMTQIASSLIMQHHIDPHYVMTEMQLWEIYPLFQVADDVMKSNLVEKRFWTYLEIMPHINTKKCRAPEDLIAFAWEKEAKQQDFEKNAAAAAAFFKKQEERLNGEIGEITDKKEEEKNE